MKRKKVDRYSWRRRGHRRRFTTESVQKDKYSPQADALIHGHNLRKVRPFARNPQLDEIKPEKYAVLSIEQRNVELRRREIKLKTYFQGVLHHRIEEYHTKWLFGTSNSGESIRALFTRDRAILIYYDLGLLKRSNTFASLAIAERYCSIWLHYKNGIEWLPINTPIELTDPAIPPERKSVANAMKPLKDFKTANDKPPEYAPVIGKGQIRNNKHLRFSADALRSEFNSMMLVDGLLTKKEDD